MARAASARPLAALAVVVVVAACGSDSGSDPGSVSLPDATSSAPSTTVAEDDVEPATTVGDDAADAPTTTSAPDDVGTAPDGLVHCDDVPVVTTDVVGDGAFGTEDPSLMRVFQTYGLERPDTFGGLWISRDARGTIVLGFTDDPEPHHLALLERAPADDPRPLGERDDVVFDVVQVDHAEAALLEEQILASTAAREAGLDIGGLGVVVTRNRVSMAASDWRMTTDEVAGLVDVLRASDVDLSMMCIEGEIIDGPEPDPPFAPGDQLDVIVLPDADGSFPPDTDVECDGFRFRLGDLDSMTPYAEIDPELRLVLDDWLAVGEGQFVPPETWELLVEEEDRAVFVNIQPGAVSYVTAEPGSNGWVWRGAGGNRTCDVRRPLPDGLSRVDWELVVPPAADATTIELLATERACTGGTEMGERLLPADVVETDDAVRIAIAAIALLGDQSCPGNPSTPVTITLDAPLGERAIVDGLVVGPFDELAGR